MFSCIDLLNVPVEIVYMISEYLDLNEVLRLQSTNRFMFRLLKPFVKIHTLRYMNSCGICDVDFTGLNDISRTLLINMLFFIRKRVLDDMGKVVTINTLSIPETTVSEAARVKSSYYSNLYQTTCNYNIVTEVFHSVDFDHIEQCILNARILDNVFVKQHYNVYNIVKNICLYRIDYKSVYHGEQAFYGGTNRYENRRRLNMVTFYFFI